MPFFFMRRSRCISLITLCFLIFGFSGCRVYRTHQFEDPTVCVPKTYSVESGDVNVGYWWREFQSESLNSLIETALTNNLDIKQSWWQIAQACAQARIENAGRYPEINLLASGARVLNSGVGFSAGDEFVEGGGFGGGQDAITTYQITGVLTYEIDLWRRIDSQVRAACREWQASQEDLEATALTLTGTVVSVWLTIQEQLMLLKVIEEQIEASKTLLELVELRFVVGQSSALDVYQQRLQLAQTVAQKPPILSLLETSKNQLKVLLGYPPECELDVSLEDISLPPFPNLNTPSALFTFRPDLRAAQQRLEAADYEIASAIADRFPRFNLDLSYGFRAMKIQDLFNSELYSIAGDILTPIFDAGRRRAEVDRRKAILCELLFGYSQLFLNALQEIEDAITQENYTKELIEQIDNEIEIANSNLNEARSRYVNGLNDYLTVIAAIQSLQNFQRERVSEAKNLLAARAQLYRALGGPRLYLCK
ncbi:MAG: efflux transporter outer membrane subunit [Chlamydiales bacterium]